MVVEKDIYAVFVVVFKIIATTKTYGTKISNNIQLYVSLLSISILLLIKTNEKLQIIIPDTCINTTKPRKYFDLSNEHIN